MKIEHENLGTCKVHLEVSLNNGKCFKLVEAMKFPREVNVSKYGWSTKTVWTHIDYDGRRKLPHYYALWGNTQDNQRMGCTKLTTAKGSNVRSFSSASKKFFELVKASEKMTFKL
jgi:hypothetical protein